MDATAWNPMLWSNFEEFTSGKYDKIFHVWLAMKLQQNVMMLGGDVFMWKGDTKIKSNFYAMH